MSFDAETSTPLSKVAAISAGFPFRGAIDVLENGPIAVIQMRNVDDAGVAWDALARVTLPTKREPDLLEPGDVILSTRGRRYFALALNEIPTPAVCSPHFFVMRATSNSALLPEFLAWQINQRPAQEHLQQAATGSHILNLTRAAVAALPIIIPPMRTQKAAIALAQIAQREVTALQALIENRRVELDAIATQILNTERLSA